MKSWTETHTFTSDVLHKLTWQVSLLLITIRSVHFENLAFLLFSFFFNCGDIHNIKFAILTIFKGTVQWY